MRKEITSVIRQELKNALAKDFESLKKEIIDVKTEIANNAAAIRTDVEQVQANVKAVEDGLSAWPDEVVSVQATVTDLKKEVKSLKEKCEDMEGRMRRGNILIMGVAEEPGLSFPTEVPKLLKEVFHLDREVLIQCSHHSLRRPGDKPCVIIAKLHNEGDALDILRKSQRPRWPI